MRILLIHNRYRRRGGEDTVFDAERALLEQAGHEIITFERSNDSLRTDTPGQRLRLLATTVWSRESADALRRLIRDTRPQVAHLHNTLPMVSPSAHHVCHDAGVPVVQTLHNYRLVCANGLMFRQGRVCELCVRRKSGWPAVRYACYRNSRSASAAVTTMVLVHRFMGTWADKIDRYIALTEFSRLKFIEAGFPADRIRVKPNFFAPDVGEATGLGDQVVFVGRLTPEKGVEVLLGAWRALAERPPLTIIGGGPLRERAERAAREIPGVRAVGERTRAEITSELRRARCLVVPSLSFENFPTVVAEAFCMGTPVVASRHGALREIVGDGANGLHFEPGNPRDLASRIEQLWSGPRETEKLRKGARRSYEEKYCARANYRQLVRIYAEVVNGASSDGRPSTGRVA